MFDLCLTLIINSFHFSCTPSFSQSSTSIPVAQPARFDRITHVWCWCTMQMFVVYGTCSFLSVSCSSRGPSWQPSFQVPAKKVLLTQATDAFWNLIQFSEPEQSETRFESEFIFYCVRSSRVSAYASYTKLLLLFILIHTQSQNIWTFFVF